MQGSQSREVSEKITPRWKIERGDCRTIKQSQWAGKTCRNRQNVESASALMRLGYNMRKHYLKV